MTLSGFELLHFLVSRGFLDQPEKIVAQIDSALMGLEISDKHDNIFWIKKVDDGYNVYPRGKVPNQPTQDLKKLSHNIRRAFGNLVNCVP